VVKRVMEAIFSLWSGSPRSGRTFRAVRTPQAVRIDSERLVVSLFLLVFTAGVILATVQAARLGLATSFGG
jgi:hypothetical protein